MLFADAFAILLVTLSLLLAFPSFWILAGVLWPNRVNATQQVLSESRIKTFFVGLIPIVGILFLVTVGSKVGGPIALLAVTFSGLGLLYCHVGVAGLARLVGERTTGDVPEPLWQTLRRGGILVAFTYLFPILGWIGMTMITTILGGGAMVRTGVFRVKPKYLPASETNSGLPLPETT